MMAVTAPRPESDGRCASYGRSVAPTFKQLEAMSDEEIKRQHDESAPHTSVGVSYYLDELRRRRFARQHRWMVAMTVATFIVAAIAAVAAVAALAS
jgi:hypothetical protein